jgi:outer membrane protein OmpA-like peptidoglycan-associated protein
LSILFIGSDRFLEVISQPNNKALLQRVAIRCRLDPLSVEDTGAYIRHRVKTAGGMRELFTPEAVREIHSLTGGNPGLINIVCDHALMKGYFDRLGTIDGGVIQAYAGNTRHLLEGDQKTLSEFKVGTTEPSACKNRSGRKWLWATPLLAAVLIPFFFFIATDLRRLFSNKDLQTAFRAIYFESNATALPGSAVTTLEEVVAYLKENPDALIRIVGHSDNVGSREVNIRVSRKRAERVKDYLVAHSVNRSRIEIEGKGPDNPVATNITSEGRRKNRRVEIEIVR